MGMDKEGATLLLANYGSSTKLFSLCGLETWCRVVDLYDADTCHVVFPFNGKDVHKIKVRVMGVDSPEMHDKDTTVKAWATKARNRMLSLLAPGVFEVDGSYTKKDIVRLLDENITIVWMRAYEYEKYGRLLADFYRSPGDTETIQSRCVEEGYCKPYGGKTKSQWVPDDCRPGGALGREGSRNLVAEGRESCPP